MDVDEKINCKFEVDEVDNDNSPHPPASGPASVLREAGVTVPENVGGREKVNEAPTNIVFSSSVESMSNEPPTVVYTSNNAGQEVSQLTENECVVAVSSSPALFVLQTLPTQSLIAGNSAATDNTTLTSLLDNKKTSGAGLPMNQFQLRTNLSSEAATVVHPQGTVVSCEDPSLAQGGIPVVIEQAMGCSSLPSTSNLSSDYFVVVENSDGSHVLSRLITGNVLAGEDKDASESTSVMSNSQPLLEGVTKESFSSNIPQQQQPQSITVVLGGSGSQLVPQNILLNSNSLLTQGTESKFLSGQLPYQTVVAASESIDNRSANLTLPVAGPEMKSFDSADMFVTDVDESYASTSAKNEQFAEMGSDGSAVVHAACERDHEKLNASHGRRNNTAKGLIMSHEVRGGPMATTYKSDMASGSESSNRESEEVKQKKLLEEQRRLIQSHLQHHIQESKKKHLESTVNNLAWTEEMRKLEKLGFSDDTQIFCDVTAELNSAILEHVPGCQQFLLDLAKKNPNSFNCSDENWSFKGDVKALIELYNSLKSLIRLRSKTLIRFQTFEESPEALMPSEKCPKNEKAVNCNLLVPYVSSRGRHLKQSHKFSGAGYIQFSDSFLVSSDLQDQNDVEYGKNFPPKMRRCRRKQRRPSKNVKLSRLSDKNTELENAVSYDSQCGNEDNGNHCESLENVVSSDKLKVEPEREFLSKQSTSEDMDPLQKRLQEEQMKYREIMDKRQKHTHPRPQSNLVEMEVTQQVLTDDKNESMDGETTSSDLQETIVLDGNELPSKRRGRPPKKYDHFVTTEKMRPRNPLTESALTKQRRNYEEHMAFKFFCTQCSFKSKRQSHFLNHIQCHKDGMEKKYSCEQCDFVSISPIMLKRHELKHKKILYKCKVCAAYTTDRPGLLQRHIRLKHSSPSNVVQLHCSQCPFVCSTPQGLAKHTQKHRKTDGRRDEQEEGSHSCNECEKVFRNRMHLQRHMRDVHGPELRPHLCDTCGKAFKRTDALQQHKLVHLARSARQLPFKCSTCSKAFRSQAHLKEHMSMHSSERPYLCQYCGAAFKTQPVQKKHILTLHIKPRTHVCAVCFRQFNTKHALQRHESTHDKADSATEVAVLEMQKSEKLDMKSSQEIAVLDGQASLSVAPTATITVTGHPASCLVQDLMGSVAAPPGEETAVDQEGQSLPQNFIPGSQVTSTMYYFTEELQPL
ncbi:uncharacterized protein LOC101862846 [Aplysia californica]|uniref:Uncharacterized protein LOC101862846 n=1 Tax=Aplysia californica TaxID=6500 RepID=A0ABM0K9A3_APLCA|nr:uncharacterized protein LOC101862846 [Aplysia californica]